MNCGLIGWLVVFGLIHTLTEGHIMAVGDAHVFPGLLTPALTQFPIQSQNCVLR